MIYPPQTSLIPVTVAIARFVESNGFLQIYPYWYLGTPLKFLTGPAIPGILVGFHKFMPQLTLFDIVYSLLIASFLLGALGWSLLAIRLSGRKTVGAIVGLLFLVLPWKWLFILALSEASAAIAVGALSWGLIGISNYLAHPTLKRLGLAVAVISAILLIHTAVIPTLIVGVVALSLACSFKETRFENLSLSFKRSFIALALSFLIVTFWYTPLFWWTLLAGPSLGGKSGFRAIWGIFEALRIFAPLILAVFVVYIWGRVKGRLAVFALSWTLTFAFLTLYRFLANPAFWQDWTSWLYELEIGLAFVLAWLIPALVKEVRDIGVGNTRLLFVILISLLLPFILTWKVYNLLGSPKLVTTSLPEGLEGLHQLVRITKEQPGRVFLSGSTVFWANALYDFNQVRGGRDEAATNSWQKEAYEIREGSDPDFTKEALKDLGVDYVLVHEDNSSEYYHDFKNLEKWRSVGDPVWSLDGDIIYHIP